MTRTGFQAVVRALLVRDAHLLVSRWENSYSFAVGGGVEAGESLDQALGREFVEETGVHLSRQRLVYFHENVYRASGGGLAHEFGWYYAVEADGEVGHIGSSLPHPDSPRLTLEYIPVNRLAQARLLPEFLSAYLASDLASGFRSAPRHFVSLPAVDGTLTTREVGW
jgi:ADP-ribose pyrophosphatase YjhB (NUDIX family)